MTNLCAVNSDMLPVNKDQKDWGFFTFFLLWAGLIIQIPTYMLVVGLLEIGITSGQALLVVFFGSLLILCPIILCSDPGYRYGIPYPVFVRSVLGIKGSRISGLLKILISSGWFGIQTWIGASVFYYFFNYFFSKINANHTMFRFLSFFIFLFCNIYIVFRGKHWIKRTENICSFFLIVCLLFLPFLLQNKINSIDINFFPELNFKLHNADQCKSLLSSIIIVAGFWTTLAINISDFTRYSRSSSSHIAGQLSSILIFMLGVSYGALVIVDQLKLDCKIICDPFFLLDTMPSLPLKLLIGTLIVFATLTTNIAANLVGATNEISNLFPQYFNFKKGAIMIGCISTIMMPWYFLSNSSNYIFIWLNGYASILGPLIGIVMVDYFLIKRKKIIVEELFDNKGRYFYSNGYNLSAIIILLLVSLINLPGFFCHLGILDADVVPSFLKEFYNYTWLVGLILASFLYYIVSILLKVKKSY